MFSFYTFRGNNIIKEIENVNIKTLWDHLNSYVDGRLQIHIYKNGVFYKEFVPGIGFI